MATRQQLTHEKIVGVGRIASHTKEFHQVVELPVDVATYCHRGGYCDDVALFDQQLARLVAQLSDLGLGDRTACSQLSDGALVGSVTGAEGKSKCGTANTPVQIAHGYDDVWLCWWKMGDWPGWLRFRQTSRAATAQAPARWMVQLRIGRCA